MEKQPEEEQEPVWKGPYKILLAAFLILLISAMAIPYYSVRLDPAPTYIPTIEDVFDTNQDLKNEIAANSISGIKTLIRPNDPLIKQTADRIVYLACEKGKVCYAKAIFYFVRNNIQYVNDPIKKEYIKGAKETLTTGVGDCDDLSATMANLLQAVGIPTRFVLIQNHIYVQIYLDEALDKYKQKDGWINLDPTCYNCEFSEVGYSTIVSAKRII